MAWSELHDTVHNELKIQRLARLLEIPYAHAAGLVVCLWSWATGHQRDGDLSELTDEEIIRDVCRWEGNSNGFLSYFQKVGLLDGKKIHNWEHKGVKLLESDRYRKQMKRKSLRRWSKEHPRTVSGTSVLPNHTKPNQTVPRKDIKDGTDEGLRAFMSHFTQTLKTKTGQDADPKFVRKAYGKVIAYLKTYPQEQPELNEEMDRTPPNMPQAWYVAFLCGQIEQRTHEKIKAISEQVVKAG